MVEIVQPANTQSSGGVDSINGLTGDITLSAGTGISLGTSGNTITISETATVIAQSTTPENILSSDNAKYFTNEGASAEIVFNLPTAVAGLIYHFIVQDTDGIKVVANTGDTIRLFSAVSASEGYTESLNVGSTITLLAINADEWIGVNAVGSWVVV